MAPDDIAEPSQADLEEMRRGDDRMVFPGEDEYDFDPA
jgi:hypothetical protein